MGSIILTAGELDQRITLQTRAVDSLNNLGENVAPWVDWASRWAKVEPLTGRELFAAGQLQSTASMRISMRYLAGVLPTMRVLWGGVPYEIVGEPINLEGRNVTLQLMCTAGLRDGR